MIGYLNHYLGPRFDELETIRREIDQIFSQAGLSRRQSFPPVNLYDGRDELILVAEVPGIKQADLQMTLEEHVFKLSGQRNGHRYGEKTVALRQERARGAFEKTVRLPVAVEADKVSARLEDGLLTVTFPKAEEAKPRQITIQA